MARTRDRIEPNGPIFEEKIAQRSTVHDRANLIQYPRFLEVKLQSLIYNEILAMSESKSQIDLSCKEPNAIVAILMGFRKILNVEMPDIQITYRQRDRFEFNGMSEAQLLSVTAAEAFLPKNRAAVMPLYAMGTYLMLISRRTGFPLGFDFNVTPSAAMFLATALGVELTETY